MRLTTEQKRHKAIIKFLEAMEDTADEISKGIYGNIRWELQSGRINEEAAILQTSNILSFEEYGKRRAIELAAAIAEDERRVAAV